LNCVKMRLLNSVRDVLMRGFLYIYNKSLHRFFSPEKVIDCINNLKNAEHTFYEQSNSKMSCFYYTNDNNFKAELFNLKHVSLVGQYVDEETTIQEVLSKLTEDEATKYISS